ncbi:MAG: hypothetical protein LBG46_04340, partial [Elusimicrobiota bacterium]|nr:hypothetical protein [Elusimicrobiota bacterium]
KSIAQAKEQYYLFTGQVTGDVDLLDITFPYKSKTLREDGTYYDYQLDNFDGYVAVRNLNDGVVLFITSPYGYTIDYNYPRQSTCKAPSDSKGENICKIIGTFQKNYGTNNVYTINAF